MTSYLFFDYIFHVHIVRREMLLMMIIHVVVGVKAHCCSLPMMIAHNRKLIAMAHNYYHYHYYNYH